MRPYTSMVGRYGLWLKKSIDKFPKEFSFLNKRWEDISEWRKAARQIFFECISFPELGKNLVGKTKNKFRFDGLIVEELTWQLPFGPPTEAFFLKPEYSDEPDAKGQKRKLPGIVALHDHGGNKYFGKSKIVRISDQQHPFLHDYQKTYYGGVGWASELAKRGYGVLVHDVFPFESRKVLASELPGYVVKRMMGHPEDVREVSQEDVERRTPIREYDGAAQNTEDIQKYNAFAGQHENIIAKSLFSAGMTWPGLYLFEDMAAVDYLCSREDIDSSRVGCGGLSGGGMRTNCLAAVDNRIQCAVSVGFMTTWKDFALYTCYTHTWMIYTPLLPKYMDYPDILSMRAPRPTMVLSNTEDPLFTRAEVKRSEDILKGVFKKAKAEERFCMKYYPGPHKFDIFMQNDAFEWIDKFMFLK